MTQPDIDLAVRTTVTMRATPDQAFEVFTAGMGTWWPLDSHFIGARTPETVVMEDHAGGRWFERDGEGNECDWGRVLAWEPPQRVLLAWQLDAEWRYDPAVTSEVEVRFVSEGPSTTRVELEHRGLGVFGDRADQMRQSFDADGGWQMLLGLLAATTEGQSQ